MWEGKQVSVVLPTYAERNSIRGVIEGFDATGHVDEIIVVNNNAESGTSERVAKTNAREIYEAKQGYGHAIHRGLAEARGELIVIAEPDGTFVPADITKLLVYSGECDAVFGTRTTRELVWHMANMGGLLRWGNWGVAKLIEALFNTSHLSDVGCTYRLLTRDLVQSLLPMLRVGGNHAGPEIMLRTITSGARFVEVPVNYLPRVGRSSVTGNRWVALRLGVVMVGMILRFRLQTPLRPPRATRLEHGTRAGAGTP